MSSHSLTDVPEQTHDAMRAAAQRPVTGPTATPAQAASGGLDVPGREPKDGAMPIVGMNEAHVHEPIPGERDSGTLTHRDVGAVGGRFNGADEVAGNAEGSLDEATRRDRVLEGGGGEAERRFDKQRGGR